MLDLLPISWKSRWAGSVHSFFLRWRAFRLSSTVIGVAADLGSSSCDSVSFGVRRECSGILPSTVFGENNVATDTSQT